MSHFNQNEFIDFKLDQPPRNPPPPGFGPNQGPPQGFGPGPRPPQGGPGPRPPQGGPGPNAPRTAPPNYTPSRQIAPFRVDPSSIRNCKGRFTYVWLSNGDQFWMFPVQVSRNTVTGFRWNRFFGWSIFGVSLNRIDAFMCS